MKRTIKKGINVVKWGLSIILLFFVALASFSLWNLVINKYKYSTLLIISIISILIISAILGRVALKNSIKKIMNKL